MCVSMRGDAFANKNSSRMMNGWEDELPTIVDPKCQPYFLASRIEKEKKGYNACNVLIHRERRGAFCMSHHFRFSLSCLQEEKGISCIPDLHREEASTALRIRWA